MINFYKINMNELKMAGGLILILMAIKNLIFSPQKKRASEKQLTPEDQIKQAVIPMAFPMLVGPGSLTTALIGRAEHGLMNNSFFNNCSFYNYLFSTYDRKLFRENIWKISIIYTIKSDADIYYVYRI